MPIMHPCRILSNHRLGEKPGRKSEHFAECSLFTKEQTLLELLAITAFCRLGALEVWTEVAD